MLASAVGLNLPRTTNEYRVGWWLGCGVHSPWLWLYDAACMTLPLSACLCLCATASVNLAVAVCHCL